MKGPIALGLVCCGLGLVVGCRTPPPESRLADGDPRPERLLTALRIAGDAVPALRARARVEIRAPDLKIRRPQRLAVARPDRLRVEIVGLFGQLAAILVADNGIYQLYESGQRELKEGLVSSSLLWRVARVDLEPRDAVDLLLGSPRPEPGLQILGALRQGSGGIRFDRVDAQGRVRERYAFDEQGRLTETERVNGLGEVLWRARFGAYRAVARDAGPDSEFAFEMELDFPRVDGRAKLNFQQVDLVASLPDETFKLALPGRKNDPSGTEGR